MSVVRFGPQVKKGECADNPVSGRGVLVDPLDDQPLKDPIFKQGRYCYNAKTLAKHLNRRLDGDDYDYSGEPHWPGHEDVPGHEDHVRNPEREDEHDVFNNAVPPHIGKTRASRSDAPPAVRFNMEDRDAVFELAGVEDKYNVEFDKLHPEPLEDWEHQGMMLRVSEALKNGKGARALLSIIGRSHPYTLEQTVLATLSRGHYDVLVDLINLIGFPGGVYEPRASKGESRISYARESLEHAFRTPLKYELAAKIVMGVHADVVDGAILVQALETGDHDMVHIVLGGDVSYDGARQLELSYAADSDKGSRQKVVLPTMECAVDLGYTRVVKLLSTYLKDKHRDLNALMELSEGKGLMRVVIKKMLGNKDDVGEMVGEHQTLENVLEMAVQGTLYGEEDDDIDAASRIIATSRVDVDRGLVIDALRGGDYRMVHAVMNGSISYGGAKGLVAEFSKSPTIWAAIKAAADMGLVKVVTLLVPPEHDEETRAELTEIMNDEHASPEHGVMAIAIRSMLAKR